MNEGHQLPRRTKTRAAIAAGEPEAREMDQTTVTPMLVEEKAYLDRPIKFVLMDWRRRAE